MLMICIADVERDVGMKNLSPKEAITILEGMRIDIPLPKAAVTQIKRNLALDMAINALNCSEIPNNSDTISRQAVTKFLNDWLSCLFENCHKQSASDLKMIIKDFKNLPSVQPETNCSEIPNSSDTISEQALLKALETVKTAKLEIFPSIQPEQRWIPVSEIPPRGRDLMLKIYDKHNLFYYYHMGFHDGEKYYTYNFFWWEDKDLEIVGWQLCPWEGEQE